MADVDSDIAETLSKMDSALHTINKNLMPLLSSLDEDKLVSYYSLPEQARINLSAAFTLAFALYSLDKLNNHIPISQKSRLSAQDNVVTYTGGGTTDAQLVYKIERITEYIKKLKDITLLSRAKQAREVAVMQNEQTNEDTANNLTPHKKRKKESNKERADKSPVKKSKLEKVTGDDAMFAIVTKIPGQTSNAVSQLIRHVDTIEEELQHKIHNENK